MNIFEEFRERVFRLPDTKDLACILDATDRTAAVAMRYRIDDTMHLMVMEYLKGHVLSRYPVVTQVVFRDDRSSQFALPKREVIGPMSRALFETEVASCLDNAGAKVIDTYKSLFDESLNCARRHESWSRKGVWSSSAQKLVDHVTLYPRLAYALTKDVEIMPWGGVVREGLKKKVEEMERLSQEELIQASSALEGALLELNSISQW